MRDSRNDSGQTLVFTVVMFGVIFAFAALVIDSGQLLLTRRNMQGDADSAALAAARELTVSQSQATSVAKDYVENKNSADLAKLDSVTYSNNNTRARVVVSKKQQGAFAGFFTFMRGGKTKAVPTVRAHATVEIAQVTSTFGMLPFGLMRNSYTLGTNTEIKWPTPGNGNRGAVAPPNSPPTCNTSTGANDFANMIRSSTWGGVDSCGVDVTETMPTETGNMTGKVEQGFNDRIGAGGKNSETFNDVLEWDASAGRYIVKKPNSPRIGMVPVIENTNGTTAWPSGRKDVRVVGYVMVYIGNTARTGQPAYYPDGRSVWMTPIRAMLPEEYSKAETISPYDPTHPDDPMVIRLVE